MDWEYPDPAEPELEPEVIMTLIGWGLARDGSAYFNRLNSDVPGLPD